MKKLYLRRALLKKKRPPKRLKRLLYPERVEAQYRKTLEAFLGFLKSKVDEKVKPLLPGLVAYYGRDRKDAADEPQKYYTAFIYDKTEDPKVLHVTHKYLGELSPDGVKAVEKIVDKFFLDPRELPRARFDRRQLFGPNQDVPVLTSVDFNEGDFEDLRSSLDEIREEDYPEYRPHVTTDASSVDRPFSHYALISKNGIRRTWPKTARQDADDLGDLADALEEIRIETSQDFTDDELKRLATLTGKSVEEFNAAQMNGQLSGIVEIDLLGNEPWLAREMGAFVVQNVGLIKSIEDEYLNQVQSLVATSVRSGLRVEDIAADLEDRFDVSASRARLIARDQVGKFNGQLTEARQKDLGVETYIWRGVGDERERDSHRLLNNTTQRWDDPPEVGHPGEDFQCRCWAEPDLSDYSDDES